MAEADMFSATPSHPLIESDHVEGTAVYDANGKQIGTINPNFPDAHTRWGPESPNFGYPSRE